jgi:membrane-associated protease RseP (regulator of RpoE activity)
MACYPVFLIPLKMYLSECTALVSRNPTTLFHFPQFPYLSDFTVVLDNNSAPLPRVSTATSLYNQAFDTLSSYCTPKKPPPATYPSTSQPTTLASSVIEGTEKTLGLALDLLPSIVESPIRTILRNIPLIPLSLPYKHGKISIVGVGPGFTLLS